jgi:hypothetical protein
MQSSGVACALGLLVLTVFAGGCAEPSITLTAAKPVLCADGYDQTDIVAQVKLAGRKTKAGIVVSFSLGGEGSFSADPSTSVTSREVATDATGMATVTLYAGLDAGVEATVTAEFTDDESGDHALTSVSIPLVTPQQGCDGAP